MATQALPITELPIAELIEDYSIYPRESVDRSRIADYTRAIQAGAQFPPIIIDERTRRIVDGVHRKKAYERAYGSQAVVPAALRRYDNELEVIRDAVAFNDTHGLPLRSQDRTRCALMFQKQGMETSEIAIELHTTERRVEQLLVRVVVVGKHAHPAKPNLWPEKGEQPRKISKKQYDVAQSSSGWRSQQTLTQLIRELESGVMDLQNPNICQRLWELHDAIEKKVSSPQADAA